ncbi:hypothetical protein [Amycolatopsis sp. cmx-11-51]|uniref:hypothetical protein n=1 Tax=Amycolatopsis sp. cmx-11-51 TaxID=2785797 RepID=UPI0039E282D4
MPKRYPPEVREKAVRLALDRLDEYGSAYAAAYAIGPMAYAHPEALRVWIVKAFQQDTPPAGRPANWPRPSAKTGPAAQGEQGTEAGQ